MEIASLVLMSASIILLEDLEGERERERERDSCAYLLRSMGICDGSKYSLVGICYLSEYLLPYSKYGGWVFATRGRYLLLSEYLLP